MRVTESPDKHVIVLSGKLLFCLLVELLLDLYFIPENTITLPMDDLTFATWADGGCDVHNLKKWDGFILLMMG